MVFSSHLFLFYFLPAALLIYYASPRRGRHALLTVLSYVFYGWANPLFLLLLLGSTLLDYICGLIISGQWRGPSSQPIQSLSKEGPRTGGQKIALAVSICSSLSLLGFFKYFNFAMESVNMLASMLGLPELQVARTLRITLPLGISFYTFQSMSYAIDVYRGDARATRNIIDFACFVAMFPQLVAGPIIRFHEVADQLVCRTHTAEKFARGVAFVCMGLGKKILLANVCGKIADMTFNAASVTVLDAWGGVIAYALQIYYDFSGYSDMAIGLGLMLGFVFPKNFDSPYISESITEFWRRWHMSLSNWLRDNLYIPLGGNRRGKVRTYVNLALVMLLGGLWHGASWNFVIWGGIHGVLLALERANGKRAFYSGLPKPLRILITFAIVLFGWVFFRARDLPAALHYCGNMLGLGHVGEAAQLVAGLIYKPYYLVSLIIAGVITWSCPQTWDWTRSITWPKACAIAFVFLVSVIAMTTQAFNPFIYFIF